MSEEDSTKHEFFDSRITHDGDTLNVEYEQWSGNYCDGYSTETLYLDITKKDVIALANHFNLTADDLKPPTQ